MMTDQCVKGFELTRYEAETLAKWLRKYPFRVYPQADTTERLLDRLIDELEEWAFDVEFPRRRNA